MDIRSLHAQPPTVACRMEAQLEYMPTHCMNVIARLAPICVLSRCLLTKFLRRSSVGRLLRVRCWLGGGIKKGISGAREVCVCESPNAPKKLADIPNLKWRGKDPN